MGIIYNSIPVGSISTAPEQMISHYVASASRLPPQARKMVYAMETGSYLRGVAKSFNLLEEKSSVIAFTVVRVAIGEISFNQLASALTAELSLPTNRAQSMAQEIEKDLFSPIKQELKEHWAKIKRSTDSSLQNSTKYSSGALKPSTEGQAEKLSQVWPSGAGVKRPPAQPMKASQNPSPPPAAIPPNVLNLKEQPKVILPPPMPPSI